MPNVIHIYFALVLWFVLCGGVFILGIHKSLRQPQVYQLAHQDLDVPDQEVESKEPKDFNDDHDSQEETDSFQKELDQIYRQMERLEENKDEIRINNEESSKYSNIYQAFDSGQSITDIARNWGKNEGEIELIINLRRYINL